MIAIIPFRFIIFLLVILAAYIIGGPALFAGVAIMSALLLGAFA